MDRNIFLVLKKAVHLPKGVLPYTFFMLSVEITPVICGDYSHSIVEGGFEEMS